MLCGDSGVGKVRRFLVLVLGELSPDASAQSNILGRYTKDEFSEHAPSTIGVEFTTKVRYRRGGFKSAKTTFVLQATLHDGKNLAIQIWDTGVGLSLRLPVAYHPLPKTSRAGALPFYRTELLSRRRVRVPPSLLPFPPHVSVFRSD